VFLDPDELSVGVSPHQCSSLQGGLGLTSRRNGPPERTDPLAGIIGSRGQVSRFFSPLRTDSRLVNGREKSDRLLSFVARPPDALSGTPSDSPCVSFPFSLRKDSLVCQKSPLLEVLH